MLVVLTFVRQCLILARRGHYAMHACLLAIMDGFGRAAENQATEYGKFDSSFACTLSSPRDQVV